MLSVQRHKDGIRERLQIGREIKRIDGLYEISGVLIASWTNPDTTRAIGFVGPEERGRRAVQEVRHLATRSYWDPVHVSDLQEGLHVSFAYAGSLWIERISPGWRPEGIGEPHIQSSRILDSFREGGLNRLLLSSGPGAPPALKVVDLPRGEVIETLSLKRSPRHAALSAIGDGPTVIAALDDDGNLSIHADGRILAECPGAFPLPTYDGGSWMSRDERGNVYVVWTSELDGNTLPVIGARVSVDRGELRAEIKLLLRATHNPPGRKAVLLGGKENLFLGWIDSARGEETTAIGCWKDPINCPQGQVTWRPRPDYLVIP